MQEDRGSCGPAKRAHEELEAATFIEGDAAAAVADAAKKSKPRGTPKRGDQARDRLKAAIRRYSGELVMLAP